MAGSNGTNGRHPTRVVITGMGAITPIGLSIEEFALYDPDALRLGVIGPLAARRAGTARVTTHAAAAPALEGARYHRGSGLS